jgi:hypothetical protein
LEVIAVPEPDPDEVDKAELVCAAGAAGAGAVGLTVVRVLTTFLTVGAEPTVLMTVLIGAVTEWIVVLTTGGADVEGTEDPGFRLDNGDDIRPETGDGEVRPDAGDPTPEAGLTVPEAGAAPAVVPPVVVVGAEPPVVCRGDSCRVPRAGRFRFELTCEPLMTVGAVLLPMVADLA